MNSNNQSVHLSGDALDNMMRQADQADQIMRMMREMAPKAGDIFMGRKVVRADWVHDSVLIELEGIGE